jgi:hypothetical protein
MNTTTERENGLRALAKRDHDFVTREYRNAMHLHGDPSQSDNVSDEEMIQAILKAEGVAATAH